MLKDGILDIFCGIGGFSLGFMQAGYDIVYSNDIHKNSIATIQHNHVKIAESNDRSNFHTAVLSDIRQMNFDRVEAYFKEKGFQIHGIIGGPPCQGFSFSNRKTRSLENPWNSLYKEYIKMVRWFKPDFFVFENVPGIMAMPNGQFIGRIKRSINNKMGYALATKILDAADFGVPQIRKRVIIVGILQERVKSDYVDGNKLIEELAFPKPLKANKVTVKQAIGDLPEINSGNTLEIMNYRRLKPTKYASKMRETPELMMKSLNVLNHVNTKNTPLILQRYQHIPQGGNWKNIPETLLTNYRNKSRCHSGIYKRLKENEPCVALNNIRKSMYIHPTQDRGLSIREAARLQSFPDWYEFIGSLHERQQMVADAVPPLMAKAIAEQIKSMLLN